MRAFLDFAASEVEAAIKEVEASFDAANESNPEMETLREKFMKPQEEARQRILTIAGSVDTALRMYPKENEDLTYEAELLYRLMNFKPLTTVLGEESEWIPLPDIDLTRMVDLNFGVEPTAVEINRRCPSVVRLNHDNKYAWDNDGRIFTNDDGKNFFRDWRSAKKISFPYLPDTTPEMLNADVTLDDCAYISPDDIPEDVKADLQRKLAEEKGGNE